MANIIGSPSRYVQGKGELSNLCTHAERLGKSFFVLVSGSGKKRVEDKLTKSAQQAGAKLVYEIFNGECCQSEIDRAVSYTHL